MSTSNLSSRLSSLPQPHTLDVKTAALESLEHEEKRRHARWSEIARLHFLNAATAEQEAEAYDSFQEVCTELNHRLTASSFKSRMLQDEALERAEQQMLADAASDGPLWDDHPDSKPGQLRMFP